MSQFAYKDPSVPRETTKDIHIYNFDSLVVTPRPNPFLHNRATFDFLNYGFVSENRDKAGATNVIRISHRQRVGEPEGTKARHDDRKRSADEVEEEERDTNGGEGSGKGSANNGEKGKEDNWDQGAKGAEDTGVEEPQRKKTKLGNNEDKIEVKNNVETSPVQSGNSLESKESKESNNKLKQAIEDSTKQDHTQKNDSQNQNIPAYRQVELSAQLVNKFGWWAEPLFFKGMCRSDQDPQGHLDVSWEDLKQSRFQEFFREDLVAAALDSMEDPEVEMYLVCDRPKDQFSGLVAEILETRDLRFDGVLFKQSTESSDLAFRTHVVKSVIAKDTRTSVEQLSFYDEPYNINNFKKVVNVLNSGQVNLKYLPTFVEVLQPLYYLHPIRERYLLEKYIDLNNQQIETLGVSSQFYSLQLREVGLTTGFQLDDDTIKALSATFAHIFKEHPDLHYGLRFVDFIPRSARRADMDKIGGRGSKHTFQVSAVGHFRDELFAAKLMGADAGILSILGKKRPLAMAIAYKNANGQKLINMSRHIKKWAPIDPPIEITGTTYYNYQFVIKILQKL